MARLIVPGVDPSGVRLFVDAAMARMVKGTGLPSCPQAEGPRQIPRLLSSRSACGHRSDIPGRAAPLAYMRAYAAARIDPVSVPLAGVCVCYRLLSSLDNQVGHYGGLGEVDRVASRCFDHSRSRTLGHEALGGRWDHPVLSGH